MPGGTSVQGGAKGGREKRQVELIGIKFSAGSGEILCGVRGFMRLVFRSFVQGSK